MIWMHINFFKSEMISFHLWDTFPGLYLLLVCRSSVLSSVDKSFSVMLRSGDLLSHLSTFHLFTLRRSCVAVMLCFGSLFLCTVNWFRLNLSRKYSSSTHYRNTPVVCFELFLSFSMLFSSDHSATISSWFHVQRNLFQTWSGFKMF